MFTMSLFTAIPAFVGMWLIASKSDPDGSLVSLSACSHSQVDMLCAGTYGNMKLLVLLFALPTLVMIAGLILYAGPRVFFFDFC